MDGLAGLAPKFKANNKGQELERAAGFFLLSELTIVVRWARETRPQAQGKEQRLEWLERAKRKVS